MLSYLKKKLLELYDPAISLLGKYLKELKTGTVLEFIAALVTIIKR